MKQLLLALILEMQVRIEYRKLHTHRYNDLEEFVEKLRDIIKRFPAE
jgi:hypothetical protein